MDYLVTHIKNANRFEVLLENGQTAYLNYNEFDNSLNLSHTYVPKSFEGKGIAAAIVKIALDYARKNNLSIIPSCPYVAAYIERHPEHRDLVKQT